MPVELQSSGTSSNNDSSTNISSASSSGNGRKEEGEGAAIEGAGEIMGLAPGAFYGAAIAIVLAAIACCILLAFAAMSWRKKRRNRQLIEKSTRLKGEEAPMDLDQMLGADGMNEYELDDMLGSPQGRGATGIGVAMTTDRDAGSSYVPPVLPIQEEDEDPEMLAEELETFFELEMAEQKALEEAKARAILYNSRRGGAAAADGGMLAAATATVPIQPKADAIVYNSRRGNKKAASATAAAVAIDLDDDDIEADDLLVPGVTYVSQQRPPAVMAEDLDLEAYDLDIQLSPEADDLDIDEDIDMNDI